MTGLRESWPLAIQIDGKIERDDRAIQKRDGGQERFYDDSQLQISPPQP